MHWIRPKTQHNVISLVIQEPFGTPKAGRDQSPPLARRPVAPEFVKTDFLTIQSGKPKSVVCALRQT